MAKQVVILFGPPGAGKGTQAELLSESTGFYLFETSKILEKEFKRAETLPENSKERFAEYDGQKFDIMQEKENWKSGVLNSPPFVTYLITKEIQKLFDEDKSLVLAGSPRTVYEVEKLMPFLENLYGKENIKVVLLEIGVEQTIFRNSNRKICELMRHSIFHSAETEKLTRCPIDNSKLVKRAGLDNPETIKVRLKEYSERTIPMFDYFEKNNFKFVKINGEKSIEEVFGDVLKAVK